MEPRGRVGTNWVELLRVIVRPTLLEGRANQTGTANASSMPIEYALPFVIVGADLRARPPALIDGMGLSREVILIVWWEGPFSPVISKHSATPHWPISEMPTSRSQSTQAAVAVCNGLAYGFCPAFGAAPQF